MLSQLRDSQNGASGSDSDDGSDAEEEAEEETRVVLKLQCSRGTLQLRTKTQNQMHILFETFRGQAKNNGGMGSIDTAGKHMHKVCT